MSYQPFLISNFATGFDRERQPWLLPNDAQQELLDGFVYRGVWEKRLGYDPYADGQRGSAPYCESRMVHRINSEVIGAGDGSTLVYDATLAHIPVRRGTVSVSYTISATPHTATDNGLGVLTGTDLNSASSTIDYTTGAIHLVFTVAPDNATDITATYDYHQGLPVMGVMIYYTDSQVKEMIVADTTYVNRYNATTNRLDDISPDYSLSGSSHDFFSWVNYDSPNDNPRLLFVNNKKEIQRYDGTTVSPYPVYTAAGDPVSGADFDTGNGSAGPYTWSNSTPVAVFPTSVTITAGAQVVTDDGFGNLIGDGSGTIDYLSGATSVTFSLAVAGATPITIDYTPQTDPITTALHIFQFKDRLVVLAPTLNAKYLGKTILISGTGRFGDTFAQFFVKPDTTKVYVAGSGRIDISDDSFIDSADFNRDDLIVFTENSTWIQKYTGNDAVPFELNKIDNSRGTQAPHGTISYLNLTTGESPRGFIGCDGYSVERTDDKIPRFSYDDIDIDNFDLCFAGTVDEDRDHYLIYPSTNLDPALKSDQILITNYEEFNYSIYRIPLSCMGNFYNTQDITWDDLGPGGAYECNSWEEMALRFSTWDAFVYQNSTPIGIGGGHHGEITSLNESQSGDDNVKIRGISGTNSLAVTITTDYQQFQVNDYVYIAGIEGAVELNNKQGIVTDRTDNSLVVQIDTPIPYAFSAYTGGGEVVKVITFQSTTKKFNPFADSDKKVRCGWLYLYVTTTGTLITDTEGNPVDAILKVRVIVNDTEQPTTLTVPNSNYYEVNLTSHGEENGIKKWYKLWINQTGRFIQFELSNTQAGAQIQIQALMPGFAPVGRLV